MVLHNNHLFELFIIVLPEGKKHSKKEHELIQYLKHSHIGIDFFTIYRDNFSHVYGII